MSERPHPPTSVCLKLSESSQLHQQAPAWAGKSSHNPCTHTLLEQAGGLFLLLWGWQDINAFPKPSSHTSTASTFLRSMLSICSENFFTSSKPSTSLIFRVGSTSLYFYSRERGKILLSRRFLRGGMDLLLVAGDPLCFETTALILSPCIWAFPLFPPHNSGCPEQWP